MKQRSKAELLNVYKVYKSIEKDTMNNGNLKDTTGLWRCKVEWAIILLEKEKFSRNDVLEIFKTLNEYDNLWDLENEDELRNNILKKNTEIIPMNCYRRSGNKKDIVNSVVDNMVYYNTKRATNIALIILNWLIDNKGYGKKRIERDLLLFDSMDCYPSGTVEYWNNVLREKYSIYIELGKEDIPDKALVV